MAQLRPSWSNFTLAYHKDNKKLIPFLLSDSGEGIAEVEVLQWFVQPVKQFDKICQVQSDKANVEITSRFDGIIESLATTDCSTSGDMLVWVGTPLVSTDICERSPSGEGVHCRRPGLG